MSSLSSLHIEKASRCWVVPARNEQGRAFPDRTPTSSPSLLLQAHLHRPLPSPSAQTFFFLFFILFPVPRREREGASVGSADPRFLRGSGTAGAVGVLGLVEVCVLTCERAGWVSFANLASGRAVLDYKPLKVRALPHRDGYAQASCSGRNFCFSSAHAVRCFGMWNRHGAQRPGCRACMTGMAVVVGFAFWRCCFSHSRSTLSHVQGCAACWSLSQFQFHSPPTTPPPPPTPEVESVLESSSHIRTTTYHHRDMLCSIPHPHPCSHSQVGTPQPHSPPPCPPIRPTSQSTPTTKIVMTHRNFSLTYNCVLRVVANSLPPFNILKRKKKQQPARSLSTAPSSATRPSASYLSPPIDNTQSYPKSPTTAGLLLSSTRLRII